MKTAIIAVSIAFLLAISVCVYAQTGSQSFDGQKKSIDSFATATDKDPALTKKQTSDSSAWGNYTANIYTDGKQSVVKIECVFNAAPADKKILYYRNNQLVKIMDKSSVYYYIGNNLLLQDGAQAIPAMSDELLAFEEVARKRAGIATRQ